MSYGCEVQTVSVQFPAGAGNFLLPSIHTCSGGQLGAHSVGTD
jgi:hypothetical protein